MANSGTTSVVTGDIELPGVASAVGWRIVFTLNRVDTDGTQVIIPQQQVAVVQSDGTITISLWRTASGSANAWYDVTAVSPDSQTTVRVGQVNVPDAASANLNTLLNTFVSEGGFNPPFLTQAQAAVDAAEAAVDAAEGFAAAAQASATSSEASAVASGAPIFASTSLGIAGTIDGGLFYVPVAGALDIYENVAGVATYVNTILNPRFASVAAFNAAVTAGYTAPDGTVVSAGPVQFQADSSATVPGLPVGWVKFSGRFQDGTVGEPGISFWDDPDTGFYRPGANRMASSKKFEAPEFGGSGVQSNSTDSTAGRLMTVGAFGLGSASPAIAADMDDHLIRTGVWRVSSPETTGTRPVGESLFGMLLVMPFDASQTHQWYYPVIGGTQYYRFYRADLGGWQPWQQSTKATGWIEIPEVATTSGTAFYVTSIPAGVTEIEIYFDLVGLSGSNSLLVQIGDSVGIETTGYLSHSVREGTARIEPTNGFGIILGASTVTFGGSMRLFHKGGNRWLSEHVGTTFGAARGVHGSGQKTLSAEVNQLRITRTGTDTFVSGAFKVRYR